MYENLNTVELLVCHFLNVLCECPSSRHCRNCSRVGDGTRLVEIDTEFAQVLGSPSPLSVRVPIPGTTLAHSLEVTR